MEVLYQRTENSAYKDSESLAALADRGGGRIRELVRVGTLKERVRRGVKSCLYHTWELQQ